MALAGVAGQGTAGDIDLAVDKAGCTEDLVDTEDSGRTGLVTAGAGAGAGAGDSGPHRTEVVAQVGIVDSDKAEHTAPEPEGEQRLEVEVCKPFPPSLG